MGVWVILHVSLSRLAIDEDDTCSRVPRIAPSDASVTLGSELNSGMTRPCRFPLQPLIGVCAEAGRYPLSR